MKKQSISGPPTWRDYKLLEIATAAMKGLLQHPAINREHGGIAEAALSYAEELLSKWEKKTGQKGGE